MWFAIEIDRPANNALIASESALPDSIAEYYNMIVTGNFFISTEGSPEHRLNPEHRKHAGRKTQGPGMFGTIPTGQVQRPEFRCAHLLKGLALPSPIRILGWSDWAAAVMQ